MASALITFKLDEYEPGKKKKHYFSDFQMTFEFVAVPELIADVERAMSEIVEVQFAQLEVNSHNDPASVVGSRIEVTAEVIGMELFREDTLTQDFWDQRQKKPVNLESVQNDIRYIDNMLVSEAPVLDVRKWIYHVLNKHFDIEIPEAMKPDAPVESEPVK